MPSSDNFIQKQSIRILPCFGFINNKIVLLYLSVMNKNQSLMAYVDLSPLQQDRIVKMCSTYGLNQQETNQLIAELRLGSASFQGESTNEAQPHYDRKLASIVSAKNQQLSFNDSEFKFQSEYSFKPLGKNGITSQEHSFEKALIGKMKEDNQQKFQELRIQNQILLKEKNDLQNKVNMLLQMKAQQSEIIVGLKNAVCTLTSLLKDKEQAYTDLHQNYQKLSNVLTEKLNTQRDLQKPEKDSSSRRIDHKPSRQSILTEVQINSNFQRKQSKQLSKIKSSQNICQKMGGEPRPSLKWSDTPNIENRQSKEKGPFRKQNKLDMSKYKVFIQELKNICSHKPQRV